MNKKLIAAAVGMILACVLIHAGCTLSGAEPPQKNIIKPYISVQPLSASYYTGPYGNNSLSYPGTPPELKVAAYDWRGEDGSLSYQWYTFTDIEEYCQTGGSAAGVTPNAYFIIPDPKGTHKEGPLGEERDVSNTFQYIRGYGGMDVAWGNFPRTTTDDTELMYDPERLGYNMLRIMIRADNVDPGETIKTLLAGDRPDYYNNVKIVNKYGGYVAASPWSPPKDWKSNNSINGGGNLLPGYYKLFANYLRNFAQNIYDL